MNNGDLDAGFVRQRRNLILISLGLLASLHYGLTFERINILGNETKLPGSQPVSGLLWWFWLYFLWRYWTAFMDIPDRGIAAAFSTASWRVFVGHARRWWNKTQRPKVREGKFEHTNPKGNPKGNRQGPWWRRSREFTINCSFESEDGKGRAQAVCEWRAPLSLLVWCVVVGALLVAFRTSKVSEFLMPFAVAAAPVTYWLWLLR